MNLKALAAISLAIVIKACSPGDQYNYEIKGELDNAGGERIYLFEMTSLDLKEIDSAKIDTDKSFRFTGKIEEPRFMALQDKPGNNVTLLVQPGEELFLTGDINDLRTTYTVEGSPGSKRIRKLNREMDKTLDQLDSLGNVYRDKLDEPSTDIEALRADIREKHQAITEKQRRFTIDFIEENPGCLASLMALYKQIDHSTFVLGQPDDLKYYKLVDSVMHEKYPELDYVVTLRENVEEIKANLELRRERETRLEAGVKAPEIALPNPEGDTVTLSSFRGDYVLLNFWASWDEKSREKNAKLVEIYNKYNPHGLEVYQVSLDRNRESWVKGISEDNTGVWTHVSDLRFWGSSVVPVYELNELPVNFLLDKEGRIIAGNFPASDVDRIMESLIN